MSTILQLNDVFKVNGEYFTRAETIQNLPNSNAKFVNCRKLIYDVVQIYGLKFSETTGQWDLYSWDGQQWGLEEANVKVSE